MNEMQIESDFVNCLYGKYHTIVSDKRTETEESVSI